MLQGSHGLTRDDAIFERCWWLYAACREHLFTDHTREIAALITPMFHSRARNHARHHLLEVGCGPGFYSRRLAELFPQLDVTGIDTSERLLTRARSLARRSKLANCRFLRSDAHSLAECCSEADVIIASRLFLILTNRDLALHAMFRRLRPGGICFVAEPTSQVSATMLMWAMQRIASLRAAQPVSISDGSAGSSAAEPQKEIRCSVLSGSQFQQFIGTQPWQHVRLWQDGRYQYALCEKAA